MRRLPPYGTYGKRKKQSDEEASHDEGQIRGIEKMVENDAYCPDIVMQVSAVSNALNSFNKLLLAAHIRGCVTEDIKEGKDDKVDELCTMLQKLMK